jgi:AraC-like DNA-binding protein
MLVRGVLDVLHARGISTTELLNDTPWTEERLSDMRTRLGHGELELLITRGVRLARDPALGLRVGSSAPDTIGQIVSYVALSAASLEDAFARFVHFSPLLFDGFEFRLARGTEHARLSYTLPNVLDPQSTRFVAEFASAFLAKLGARRFGRGTSATSFGFAYSCPDYVHDYQDVLGANLRFDQPSFSFDFPLAWLEQPQAHGDSLMLCELTELAERLLVRAFDPVSTVDRVRTRLRQTIEPIGFDNSELAKEMRMSVRVLRRRLAGEGVTLTGLRKLILRERAMRELLRPNANIKNIAEQLGYSEPSAFHRAFKRWTGSTPSQYVREWREAEAQGREARP